MTPLNRRELFAALVAAPIAKALPAPLIAPLDYMSVAEVAADFETLKLDVLRSPYLNSGSDWFILHDAFRGRPVLVLPDDAHLYHRRDFTDG